MILKKISITNSNSKDENTEILDIIESSKQIIDRLFDDQINALKLSNSMKPGQLLENEIFMKAINRNYRLVHKSLRLAFRKRLEPE